LGVFFLLSSQKQRKLIHNLCSDLKLHHTSVGENNAGRFIAISRSGDFSALVAEIPADQSAINYSHFYELNVRKPLLVGAYYRSLDDAAKAECVKLLSSVVIEQAGIAYQAAVPKSAYLASLQPIAGKISQPIWVDNVAQLQRLGEELMNCGVFAFDCEMHSYRSYHGITCLIQISVAGRDYVIDTLGSLWTQIGPVLGPAFACPGVLKIAHATQSMDIPCLFRDFGITVVNLFDTQVAASILGAKNPPSIGSLLLHYNLLEDKSGYDGFAKTKSAHQFNDWRQRPLNADMLRYGQMDVHYLADVYTRQLLELIADGVTSAEPDGEGVVGPGETLDAEVDELENAVEDNDEQVDWNRALNANDIEDGSGKLDEEDDEAMWDGWGGSVDAQSSGSGGCSTLTSLFPVAVTAATHIRRDDIISDSKFSCLHTVLANSSKACTCLWSVPASDALSYTRCQLFKEYKKKALRPSAAV
jgi:hypothetical protein